MSNHPPAPQEAAKLPHGSVLDPAVDPPVDNAPPQGGDPVDLPEPLPALSLETVQAILDEEIDDAVANRLVWVALGYRWQGDRQRWDASGAPPEWQQDYPEPPDFIASRPATVKLTRSIRPENKQLLKEQLGFAGYKINELVPRKTRRATIANWLLGYLADSRP